MELKHKQVLVYPVNPLTVFGEICYGRI